MSIKDKIMKMVSYHQKLVILYIGLAITFVITFNYIYPVSGQTNNAIKSSPLSSSDLIKIIAPTGILSAIGSGLFNHFTVNKQLRTQLSNTIKQLKNERQAEIIKDKASLYSFCIFILARMCKNPDFLNKSSEFPEQPDKIFDSVKEIDDALKDKFYLFDTNALNNWMLLRSTFKKRYVVLSNNANNEDEKAKLKKEVENVLLVLIQEYNANITKNFKEIIGEELNTIELK